MKNTLLLKFAIIGCLSILINDVFAQCKSYTSPNFKRPFYEVETDCAKEHSESSYLSDGQNYRAQLKGDETSEFYVTFFAGNKYRIAACTDIKGGAIIYTVRDKKNNILFSNKDHENASFWDLDFSNTVECRITIQLTPETQEIAIKELGQPSTIDEEKEEGTAETDTTKKAEKTVPNLPVCAVLIIGYKQ
ncbi:MAG: hypothetical protein ABII90_01140 [Bacteroidota bacterium]